MVDVGERDSAGDVEAALVLLLEGDVGGLLVDADAEALELRLDDALVGQGLVDVEDDEDEVARLGDGDDLATAAAAVLGAFDDTGEIDNLEGGTCAGVRSGTGKALFLGRSVMSGRRLQLERTKLVSSPSPSKKFRSESLEPRAHSCLQPATHIRRTAHKVQTYHYRRPDPARRSRS